MADSLQMLQSRMVQESMLCRLQANVPHLYSAFFQFLRKRESLISQDIELRSDNECWWELVEVTHDWRSERILSPLRIRAVALDVLLHEVEVE